MVRKGTFFEKGPQKLLYILIIRFGTPLHLTQTFWFIIKLSSATSISYKVKCRNRILESVYWMAIDKILFFWMFIFYRFT